jgi:hypothetical protein
MRRIATKAVVVGGHSRNIGKTGLMAGLIRGLQDFGWTALKITQDGHNLFSPGGEVYGCAPTEQPFVLTEEREARGRGDTCRFLAAGARRSLWLRVQRGRLAQAALALDKVLNSCDWVMIESNSVLELIEPRLCIMVLDSAQRDFKSSARMFLERADALAVVGPKLDAREWAGLDARVFKSKPQFPLSAENHESPQLCRFVRRQLGLPRADSPAEVASVG